MRSELENSTSQRYLRPGGGDAWAAEAATSGRQGTQRVTRADEITAPEDVARALRLGPTASVVLRRRVMLLDGRPVELTDSYYPASFASGTPLAGLGKIPGGAVALLADLGYTADTVWEDITARLPDTEEQHELGIPEGEPVIVLTRLTLDAQGSPFAYDVMTMVAAGRHLRYRTTA